MWLLDQLLLLPSQTPVVLALSVVLATLPKTFANRYAFSCFLPLASSHTPTVFFVSIPRLWFVEWAFPWIPIPKIKLQPCLLPTFKSSMRLKRKLERQLISSHLQIKAIKEDLKDKNAPFGVDLLLPQVGGNARKTNVCGFFYWSYLWGLNTFSCHPWFYFW